MHNHSKAVSKGHLEHFEIKINNTFLTKHKQASCCFDLNSRQNIAESREKQVRKLDIEQLNERMKMFKIHTTATQFAYGMTNSPRSFMNRQPFCLKKSPKWLERTVLIALEAESWAQTEARSRFSLF